MKKISQYWLCFSQTSGQQFYHLKWLIMQERYRHTSLFVIVIIRYQQFLLLRRSKYLKEFSYWGKNNLIDLNFYLVLEQVRRYWSSIIKLKVSQANLYIVFSGQQHNLIKIISPHLLLFILFDLCVKGWVSGEI